MKVVFFDIGAYIGKVTELMIILCKELNIDYEIYLFEPFSSYINVLKKKFLNSSNIFIFPGAIGDATEEKALYKSSLPDGYSLYKTKWNVSPDNFEMVNCVKFSKWFAKNIKEKRSDEIYILKSNVNGSEWELFKDLIDSGLNKKIDIYCGKIFKNIRKTGCHTIDEQDKFSQYLKDNNIKEILLTHKNISEGFDLIRLAIQQKIVDNKQVDYVYADTATTPIDPTLTPRLRKRRTDNKKIREIKR
jgi:FkbM family methyltransferase